MIKAKIDNSLHWIKLNWMFIVKDELIIKLQNWTWIKLSIKQGYEHQIIAEKLEANRNLLNLNRFLIQMIQ